MSSNRSSDYNIELNPVGPVHGGHRPMSSMIAFTDRNGGETNNNNNNNHPASPSSIMMSSNPSVMPGYGIGPSSSVVRKEGSVSPRITNNDTDELSLTDMKELKRMYYKLWIEEKLAEKKKQQQSASEVLNLPSHGII